MTTARTTIHVDLDDETTVLYHCDHQGPDRVSWRLNMDWDQTIYVTGTPLQLHEFGRRLMRVANETADRFLDRTGV